MQYSGPWNSKQPRGPSPRRAFLRHALACTKIDAPKGEAMRFKWAFLVAFFSVGSVVGLVRTASAREIYLNGVRLDASILLKAVTLNGCDVKIDDKGDIYITATPAPPRPSPSPPTAASPPPPPPPAPIPPPAPKPKDQAVDLGRKGVWLVSKQTQRGIVQYDIDVSVNGALVRKVRSTEDPVVMDITRWMKPGDNTVRMVATKNIPTKRMSQSPTDIMEIIIGEGVLGGSTVSIDRVLADFTRTAQETDLISEEFTVAAR